MADLRRRCPTCGTPLQSDAAVCVACQAVAVRKPPESRRRIPLQEVILGDVEYASEAFLQSWFNWRRYEDDGTLVVYDDDFVFSGKRGDIYFSADSGFELVGPLLPRSTLLGFVGGIALIFAMAWFGVFNVFTLDNPLLYVLVAVLGLLAIVTTPLYWIKVRYRGEDGQVRNAYLAARGLFGGTKRVFRRLCQSMTDEGQFQF